MSAERTVLVDIVKILHIPCKVMMVSIPLKYKCLNLSMCFALILLCLLFFNFVDEMNALAKVYFFFLVMLVYHVFKVGIIITSICFKHVQSFIDESYPFI